MASTQGAGAASAPPPPAQEFVVRVSRETKKKYSMMKFHHSLKIDLTKCGPLKMERENNLKDYKLSHDVDLQPKFGAGSEFGREQRDEARRKKYGIYRKKYNPEDQPWLAKLGEGKQAKKFKGVKEGGVADNVSFFVFTQCPDGAFEAFPVDDWYHFTPQAKYKCLSSEEAEEQFSKRDQILDYHSIMVKKRLKKDGEGEEPEEEKETKTKKSKKKDFLLTEMDEWAMLSDDEDADMSDEDGQKEEKPKKKDKKGKDKKKKNAMKTNSDDEALEESDSMDEGQEVDYMTDSESNDEDMYVEKKGDEADEKYDGKGVEDEDGLRKIVDSGDEDEEEEEKKEEDVDEDSKDSTTKPKEKNDSDSESSASSDSESDPEKESNFSSALFMQKKAAAEKKKLAEAENRSRSSTPTDEKAKKRKAETDSPVPKKAKVEATPAVTPTPTLTPTLTPSSSTASLASEGISEEAVRRYLMRKPMTTKDLVQKFKNTGLSKDQLVNTIAKILKRIDPEKTKRKDKLYLSIKKTE